MKQLSSFYLLVLFVFLSCDKSKKELKYASFGQEISIENVLNTDAAFNKIKVLQEEDSISLKFKSNIKDVCSKKGCWIKVSLDGNQETMVKFKDYGFFVPLDSKGKEVIISGKAFKKETSIADLKHYAEDAGKTKEEIEKIISPKIEYSFLADGVLIK